MQTPCTVRVGHKWHCTPVMSLGFKHSVQAFPVILADYASPQFEVWRIHAGSLLRSLNSIIPPYKVQQSQRRVKELSIRQSVHTKIILRRGLINQNTCVDTTLCSLWSYSCRKIVDDGIFSILGSHFKRSDFENVIVPMNRSVSFVSPGYGS